MEYNQTKKCTKCQKKKPLLEFYKDSPKNDELSNFCKICVNLIIEKYYKTKNGVITTIFRIQKAKSKQRGHIPPLYSKQELSKWLINDWVFNLLFENWVNCNYIKDAKPSLDRLNDNKGYSFSNIRIVTWKENNSKGSFYQKTGKIIHTHKSICQFTKDGELINKFVSMRHAERNTGIHSGHISRVCSGKRISAGGFIWKLT